MAAVTPVCPHDSARRRAAGPLQPWVSPHRALPLPLFLLTAATLAVLFLAVLSLGQAGMCAWHDQQLRYCPGYTTTDSEEVPR
jgi:hypothetical protein